MTSQSGTPTWVTTAGPTHLERIDLSERLIDESWLQDKLDRYPELIPLEEIGGRWGPLVSLGRELPLIGKSIDNMFVSPNGDLTLVEAKLWRNPQARREVVAQILDYAADLSRLDYPAFDGIVTRSSGATSGIWQRVQKPSHAHLACSEDQFVDNVSRNLRDGRILLLIVGDGIQEGLENISGLLQQHPSLQFHLELVQMRLFRDPECANAEDLLIIPSIVGRTREVVQAVVRVERDDDGRVSIEVQPVVEESSSGRGKFASVEEFLASVEDSVSPSAAGATEDLIAWWRSLGGSTRLGAASITFTMPSAVGSSTMSSVLTMYHYGRIEGSVRPLTTKGPMLDLERTRNQFRLVGIDGSDAWPSRNNVDLSDAITMAEIRDVLQWCYSKANLPLGTNGVDLLSARRVR